MSAPAGDVENAREQRDTKRVERTKVEARAVLAALIRDSAIETTSCRFDVNWSTDAVRADVARKHLGSSLYADVIASHLSVGPRDLIDPNGTMLGGFCPENEANALWRQMVDDFRAGAVPGKQDLYEGKPIGPPRIRLGRTKITIPVFDSTFTTAAVIVSFFSKMRWRIDTINNPHQSRMFDEAGYLLNDSLHAAGYTYIYRKQKGNWARTDVNEDWNAD